MNLKGAKMESKRLTNFVAYILLMLSITNLCSCNQVSDTSFSNNLDEAIAKIHKADKNTDYNKYVDVTMKQPEIFPVENKENNLDSDKCYVSENIIFKNITNKKIKFNCRIFLDKEFISSIAYSPTSFGPINEVTLEPNKSVDVAASVLMKKMESLTNKEKNIYDKHSGRLYVELKIDDKFYSFIQEADSK